MDFSSYLCHPFMNSFFIMVFEHLSEVSKPSTSQYKAQDFSCCLSIQSEKRKFHVELGSQIFLLCSGKHETCDMSICPWFDLLRFHGLLINNIIHHVYATDV